MHSDWKSWVYFHSENEGVVEQETREGRMATKVASSCSDGTLVSRETETENPHWLMISVVLPPFGAVCEGGYSEIR